MVSVQESSGVFSITLSKYVVQKMKLKKGDEIAIIPSTENDGKFLVIR